MDRQQLTRRLSGYMPRFLRETDGVMTLLALFFFVILVAMGGLAIDIGRVYSLRGQMVAYVDQVALASAAELDGQTGAINRAYRVALGDASGGPLVATSYDFADASDTLGLTNLIFLSHITSGPGPTPQAGDTVVCAYSGGVWSPASCNNDAMANGTAHIVAVTSTPLSVSYFILPIANFFLGSGAMATTANLQMQATAGYKQVSCDITPMMICNPDEPATNTDTLYPYNPTVGNQILMKASGSGAAWQPGDFGLLDQPSAAGGVGCSGSGSSAAFLSCMFALVDPLTQCFDNNVSVAPGQKQNTSDGLNVRFDMYLQSAGKFHKNGAGNAAYNALFAPSVNVTKGLVGQGGSSCPNNFNVASTTVPLPRDANIKADTTGTVRFGTGVAYADITNYWSKAHPTSPTLPATLQTACQTSGVACRYAVYRYEIDNGMIPNVSGGENGNAMCTTPGVNNSHRDRRTLILAVINCNAVGLRGNSCSNCDYSGIPVVSTVQMFMTEPMGLVEDATGKVTSISNSSNNLYGEILGVVKPGDQSGVLHVVPFLYR